MEFSIGIKQRKPILALIEEIDEHAWVTLSYYPEAGRRRSPRPSSMVGAGRPPPRLVGKQADLFPNWQYFAFATNRTEPLLLIEASIASTPSLSSRSAISKTKRSRTSPPASTPPTAPGP